MTPEEWRKLVGAEVQKRREELGLSIEDATRLAGNGRTWWSYLESGRRNPNDTRAPNPTRSTLAGAAVALGWTPDSIQRLKRGERPVEAVTTSSPSPLTRDELRAEMLTAVDVVFRRADENTAKMVEALDNLHTAVAAQEHRLRDLEARASSPPSTRAVRKRTPATRTARSAPTPRKQS
jgi:transcriptional regulator with XRE-family HTH domain